MDSSTYLYDVSPFVVERFCQIMDSGDDTLGWRGLAVRVVSNLLEVRRLERCVAAGRSPTRELLWSWAQQNSTVQDLLNVLQDMGHHRALQLLQSQVKEDSHKPTETSLLHVNQRVDPLAVTSTAEVKESVHPEMSPSNQVPSPIKSTEITFQDIREGTRDFHLDLKISENHFSSVYRAQIRNKTYAVKLFKQTDKVSWKKLWETFIKEKEIHHLYQHPNILHLLECFSDDGRYCLLYPYLPNRSLFHRLHQDVIRPLSWQERLSIIKGVAKALHHLHTSQRCPLICGNISSDNVLLDDSLQPKLSDFGLARLRPHSINQSYTITLDTSSHSNMGYLPEENIRDGKLSVSLDVYSFGMIIMETVTGRKVIEDGSKQTLLRDLLVNKVEDSGSVDSCLQFLDERAGQWPTAVAQSLLTLSLQCTASRHRHRPNMESVLLSLSQLLPPPSCPLVDQPRTLIDDYTGPVDIPQSPTSSSIPVEHDEQQDELHDELLSLSSSQTQSGPCECSQSEVTYLSDTAHSSSDAAALDLYSSWPVQCSCSAEMDSLACEDCRANGFTPDPTDSPQSSFCAAENVAKERLINKLSLYNQGVIHTQEMFSEMELQQREELPS